MRRWRWRGWRSSKPVTIAVISIFIHIRLRRRRIRLRRRRIRMMIIAMWLKRPQTMLFVTTMPTNPKIHRRVKSRKAVAVIVSKPNI
jgi:hypothetical protein